MAARRGETIAVLNFKQFMAALKEADRATQKAAREELREAGNIVRDDARAKFDRYDTYSAAGYRTVVRQRGVDVEQRLRKTTGNHPEWGTFQMLVALYPALKENTNRIIDNFNRAFDRIGRGF